MSQMHTRNRLSRKTVLFVCLAACVDPFVDMYFALHRRRFREAAYQCVLFVTLMATCACDVAHQPHLSAIADDFGVDPTRRDMVVVGALTAACQVCVMVSPVAHITRPLHMSMHHFIVAFTMVVSATNMCACYCGDLLCFVILKALGAFACAAVIPAVQCAVTDMNAAVIAVGAGQFLGHFVSAHLSDRHNWQYIQHVAGGIVLVCCASMLFIHVDTAEHRTHHSDPAHPSRFGLSVFHLPCARHTNTRDSSSARVLVTCYNRILYAQNIFGSAAVSVATVFMFDYFARDLQWGVQRANVLSAVYALGSVSGLVLGKGLAQLCSAAVLPKYMAVCTLCAVPFVIASLHQSMHTGAVLLVFLGATLANANSANVKHLLRAANEPRYRAFALSVMGTCGAFGKALGPIAVGAMSDAWPRRIRISLVLLSWIPCAGLQFSLSLLTNASSSKKHDMSGQQAQSTHHPT